MEKSLSCEEQQAKIIEVREVVGSTVDQIPGYFTDAAILRYLRATNWDTKKASKMVVETVKWRLEYQPEKIRSEDVAHEAEIGSMYRANYLDRYGRSILVIRPGPMRSITTAAQVRFFVYGMENAIMNSAPGQHQVVWLIGYQRWKASGISLAVVRKIVHLLQVHYPERLGLAVLYDPPKIFESFWKMFKPFLEARTYEQMKFVYSNDPESHKTMEIFDKDKLERSFGGNDPAEFNFKEHSERMKEDDRKMPDFVKSGYSFIPHKPSDLSLKQSEHEVSAPRQSSEVSHKASSAAEEGLPNLVAVTK
ncbi:hypothetical protein Syun_002766 [Stephania yunnanensis]|uniref:CRAL-TRIO domain-containing protein n=1 Tax=Stephania yunnanensis TaxID=152371 RepID=A0AAP0LGD4_9MAGN